MSSAVSPNRITRRGWEVTGADAEPVENVKELYRTLKRSFGGNIDPHAMMHKRAIDRGEHIIFLFQRIQQSLFDFIVCYGFGQALYFERIAETGQVRKIFLKRTIDEYHHAVFTGGINLALHPGGIYGTVGGQFKRRAGQLVRIDEGIHLVFFVRKLQQLEPLNTRLVDGTQGGLGAVCFQKFLMEREHRCFRSFRFFDCGFGHNSSLISPER